MEARQHSLDLAHRHGFARSRSQREIGGRQQLFCVKARGKALQPQRGDIPVAIAAGALEQIKLTRSAVEKRRPQLLHQRGIVAGRRRECRIKGSVVIGHDTAIARTGLKRGLSRIRVWYGMPMAERHQIRALGRSGGKQAGQEPDAQGETATHDVASESGELLLDQAWEDGETALPSPSLTSRAAPWAALLVIAGWTGFFGWTIHREALAGALPGVWAGWIVQWSVPAMLVAVVWLLAMRTSRAEAHRFAASAALLSRESAQLEDRLKVVNRELSLAREFLAAQSRDLEALGRIAAERISTHAGELQQLITTNGAQVEAIGTASETALGNMNRLRDDLPVIANAARDVANQIGGAGNTAQTQLDRLSEGFERLGQLGSASEAQVEGLTATIDQSLGSFEAQVGRIETLVADRFVQLQTETAAYREKLDGLEEEARSAQSERARALVDEIEAIAAQLDEAGREARTRFAATVTALHDALVEKLRVVEELDRNAGASSVKRIELLRDEAVRFDQQLSERNRRFDEMMAQRQAAFDTREVQASEVLTQRLADLDEALAQRREAQLADAERLVEQGKALSAQLDSFAALMGEVSRQGDAARSSLATGLEGLGDKLAAKRAALAQTEEQLAKLTESAVRLLEIVQSGARTSREDLQNAISSAGESLAAVEERATAVNQLMLGSRERGSELSDYLITTRDEISAADSALAGLHASLAEQSEEALARLQGLRGGFARLAEESSALAQDTQGQLREALGALEAAISRAFAALDEGAREKTARLAADMGSAAVEALERSLRNQSAETIGKIEQAAAHASGVGREAAIQLRDQLVKVNELTGNLEQRVARARELAEEQVNNDFARRMALITDSLNSAAIDIAGALSTEVSDTAWDAYLKGDRGIFTRRAVRLIDNGGARDIAELYQRDETFKANVSRYIHDFEAMLRSTLSTRDGHVLSVTMLGSDMGKLYVALAQAIQRFRT